MTLPPREQPAKQPKLSLPESVIDPPPFTKAQALAIHALAECVANEAQQKIALDWIINYACATYDEPFRPERPYDTAFANGRACAGRNILRILRVNIGSLPEEN